jgi:thymidylate kinase
MMGLPRGSEQVVLNPFNNRKERKMEKEEVHKTVREGYAEIAKQSSSC